MEVSTARRGWLTDVSVSLSFLTCWDIRGVEERRNYAEIMAIMQRSVIIFEPYVANHFNNIIHMSFQIT